MDNNIYSQPEKMILRDYLALDRTILALERTFLAYARTALGLFSAGIACVKIIKDAPLFYIIGLLMIIAAPIVLFYGLHRYTLLKTRFRNISEASKHD